MFDWFRRLRASLSVGQLAEMFRGPSSRSGVFVGPDSALACSAVFACVRVVSEDTAKLPLILYRRLPGGGKERADRHPTYELLHIRPNAWQTSYEFREMMQGHLELRGNAFAFKNYIGNRLVELVPLHPDKVTVKADARFNITYKLQGDERVYTSREILHLRGLSSDGISGLSTLHYAREAVGLALGAERHGATMFGNGAQPGGMLTVPGKPTKEGRDRVGEQWDTAFSGDNSHRTAVMPEGTTWTQLGMTSEDAQFLETRKFQRSEIAAFWRIPPHKIGDLERATFSNIEQQSQDYVNDALDPRLVRWEQRLTLDLLTPAERAQGYFFEFLRVGLLRGDSAARAAFYRALFQMAALSPNDIREAENLNPVPGGDRRFVQLNMAELTEDGLVPAQADQGAPAPGTPQLVEAA